MTAGRRWQMTSRPSVIFWEDPLPKLVLAGWQPLARNIASRPRQDGHHFADGIFKRIFLSENVWISLKISRKFIPKGPINNIQALVQIMSWRRPGDKPLSEPMVVGLLTHICVTRPQWVKLLCKRLVSDKAKWFLFCFLSVETKPIPLKFKWYVYFAHHLKIHGILIIDHRGYYNIRHPAETDLKPS